MPVRHTSPSTLPKLVLAGLIVLGFLLLPAAPTEASTADTTATELQVRAPGNEVNRIRVTYNLGLDQYTVTDTAGITAQAPCTQVNPTTVTCPGAGILTLSVDAGRGADRVELDRATVPVTDRGELDGGQQNDTLIGANGPDAIAGGSGSDSMNGHDGADDYDGGGGRDTVSYPTSRLAGVTVTIGAGTANDGNALDQTAARRDDVQRDVEAVAGTHAADTIIGDRDGETLNGRGGGDRLAGGRGDDAVHGLGGNDVLFGGPGDDGVFGADDDDSVYGGGGRDLVVGGADDDFLRGQGGVDVMRGKAGIDRINARDGTRDRGINCGPGANSLERAKRDRRLDPRARSC